MGWVHGFSQTFEFVTSLLTSEGTTVLVPAPGAGHRLRVQSLIVVITTAAGQGFEIGDTSGTVDFFKAPASLAVGVYPVDAGPLGHPLTINEGLQYTATAGVGLTCSGWGWVQEL